ncbi:hypothetical protein HCN44_001570 [Aphidius gifuensis]|uniref:Peptidase S1 domain-containing protein n=1 Tax=Aphidius gifuensis TaxID=684658 RepID=A0A834XUE4_APHGI|nr:hypothetical protein HCN44_001570 [Aphidius gifuensis]
MTRYLQILNVRTMNHYLCNAQYFHMDYLHETQHCLRLPETGKITQGNAGSPVMLGRKIVGIISSLSWDLNDPVVYTRVYLYRSWIDGILLEA